MWLQWVLVALLGAVTIGRIVVNVYDRPSRPSVRSDIGSRVRE